MATFSATEKIEKKRKLNANPSSLCCNCNCNCNWIPICVSILFLFLSFSSFFSISPIHILQASDPSPRWAPATFSTSNLSNLSSSVRFSLSLSLPFPLSVLLGFHFHSLLSVELKKQISCSLQLSNKTDNHVAFKVTNLSFQLPRSLSLRFLGVPFLRWLWFCETFSPPSLSLDLHV